jgi:hypothetical protein
MHRACGLAPPLLACSPTAAPTVFKLTVTAIHTEEPRLCNVQEFMTQHGFNSIEDFRGTSLPFFTTHMELVRLQVTRLADITMLALGRGYHAFASTKPDHLMMP